jgi:hypothetical protein
MAKTLEQMRTDPKIQADANRFYEAALRMPRPACYADQSYEDWDAGCHQMVVDLMRLAYEDGCIAAAWALSMVEAGGDDVTREGV